MSKGLIERCEEKGGKIYICSNLKELVEYVKKSISLLKDEKEVLRLAVYYFYLLGSLNCEREECAFRLYLEEELPPDIEIYAKELGIEIVKGQGEKL
jgi:hypothetical protein